MIRRFWSSLSGKSGKRSSDDFPALSSNIVVRNRLEKNGDRSSLLLSDSRMEELVTSGNAAIVVSNLLQSLEGGDFNPRNIGLLAEYGDPERKSIIFLDLVRFDPRVETVRNVIEYEIDNAVSSDTEEELSWAFSRILRSLEMSVTGDKTPFISAIQEICNSEGFVDSGASERVILATLRCNGDYPDVITEIMKISVPRLSVGILTLLSNRSVPDSEKMDLLLRVSERSRLFADISFRRGVARCLSELNDDELTFQFALKCTFLYPQDAVSALIAHDAAIRLADSKKILYSGDTCLSMRSVSERIKYPEIAVCAIREGMVDYANDLLTRRRMKLDISGHRIRLGLHYFSGNFEETLSQLENTPLPHRESDEMVTMGALSLAKLGRFDDALEMCWSKIKSETEAEILEFSIRMIQEDKKRAYDTINEHYIRNGASLIGKEWLKDELEFTGIIGNPSEQVKGSGLVSVIMTCHSWNDALPLAINSIYKQTYQEIELIFVDDHSDAESVKKYDDIFSSLNNGEIEVIRIRMSENSGTYACRNEGIAVSRGKYVTFADSDDWNHPEKVERAVSRIDGGLHVTCGRYIRMGWDSMPIWNGIRYARFALSGMMISRKAIEMIGVIFDERTRVSADSEFWERAVILLGKNRVRRSDFIEIFALERSGSLTNSKGLELDWLGPSESRRKYANGFRNFHDKLRRGEINWFDSEELDFPSLKNTFENEGDIYSKRLREMLDFSEELVIEVGGKVDSEIPSRDLENDRILVTMCTYKGGFDNVGKALESLLDQTVQVDEIRLKVNDEREPPGIPDDPRIVLIVGGEDMADNGKFTEIGDHTGYVITTDDDIHYPRDYVEKMLGFVDAYGRDAIIGVHGAVLPHGPTLTRWSHYSEMRRTLVFEQEMASFSPVNVIGTGTMAFHTSLGLPKITNQDYRRMVDLHIAVWAQKNGIPMYTCPRKRDWLKELKQDDPGRIWSIVSESREMQNKMLEVLGRRKKWTVFHPSSRPIIGGDGVFGIFSEWDNRELPPGVSVDIPEIKWNNLGSNPLVSIYIPAFNCEDYIIDCIDSALGQSYPNFEVCIHNDGSTDNTLRKIKRRYGRNPRVKISSGENGGIGHASNKAIENSSGDLLLQLDSDDVLKETSVEDLVKIMRDDLVCCYGNFERISQEGEKIDDGWEWPNYSFPRLMKSMIVHPPRLFRKEAWKMVGGHNVELENAVDYDFFMRIGELGKMAHLRKTLYSYRIHQSSTSQKQTRIQTDNTSIVQKEMIKRQGITNYTIHAPNPKNPRRIEYIEKSFI